jgi:hypothetical protein
LLTVEDVACVINNIDVFPSDTAELLITFAGQLVETKEPQELFIDTPDRYKPAFIHGIARKYLGIQRAQKFCSKHANALTPQVFQLTILLFFLPIKKQEEKVDWEQIFDGLLQTILEKHWRQLELARSLKYRFYESSEM